MEYLLVVTGVGVLCGCALGAYALLDSLELQQEEDARLLHRLRLSRRRLLTMELEPRRQQRPRADDAAAYADRLETRIRGLEERLDQVSAGLIAKR